MGSIQDYVRSRIKLFRVKAGLGQKELADLVGMKRSTLAMIESLKQSVSLDQCIRIAEELNIDLKVLLDKEHPICPCCGQIIQD